MKTEVDVHVSGQHAPSLLSNTEAHPKRGLRFHHHAMDFIEKFPHGTRLSQDDFCKWASARGLLPYVGEPIEGSPFRASDAWKANLHRRHEVRFSLNKAGAHPRMNKDKSLAFVVSCVAQGYLLVLTPNEAFGRAEVGGKVQSLVGTKLRQLRYWKESSDYLRLPVQTKMELAMLAKQIVAFEARVLFEVDQLAGGFADVAKQIELFYGDPDRDSTPRLEDQSHEAEAADDLLADHADGQDGELFDDEG